MNVLDINVFKFVNISEGEARSLIEKNVSRVKEDEVNKEKKTFCLC